MLCTNKLNGLALKYSLLSHSKIFIWYSRVSHTSCNYRKTLVPFIPPLHMICMCNNCYFSLTLWFPTHKFMQLQYPLSIVKFPPAVRPFTFLGSKREHTTSSFNKLFPVCHGLLPAWFLTWKILRCFLSNYDTFTVPLVTWMRLHEKIERLC